MSAGLRPCGSECSAARAYNGLAGGWVDRAATPLGACGHSAPTAKKRLATATPRAPVASRAIRDQVMRRLLCGPRNSKPGRKNATPPPVLRREPDLERIADEYEIFPGFPRLTA